MPTQHLYADLAWLWPLLSPPEDYKYEARALQRLLAEKLSLPPRARIGDRPTLLDLGCGAGHLHSHLRSRFDVTGADLSSAMLRQAKALNPDVVYSKADLRAVDLGRSFDAVVLHDAVGYMLTKTDLRRALAAIGRHLGPSSVGVVLPDYLAQTLVGEVGAEAQVDFPGGKVHVLSHVVRGDTAATRRRHDRYTLTMTFGIVQRAAGGKPARQRLITDRHVCGLFELDTWLSLAQDVGLEPTVIHRPAGARSSWQEVSRSRALAMMGRGDEEGAWGLLLRRRAG